MALTASPADAASAGRNCFAELERGRSPLLTCTYPTRLTDKEREDLKRLTADRLLDARCTVSISIDRGQVELALAASDHVFEATPQPVACELVTREAVHPVTGTFAPRVVFQGGLAVEASPGLAGIEGISPYLAWPVVQYVNRSPGIRDGMLQSINDYRALHEARRTMSSRR